MSADARLAILARVRQAQIRAYLPEAPAGLPARLAYPATGPSARRARLAEELKLLGVEVFEEPDAEAVRRRIKGLIAGKSILSWDAERLPYGAGDALRGETVAYGADARALQAQAEIGLTGCEAALAETGTLAIVSGPGRPRTASLLPITHIAVVRGEDVLQGMGEFLQRHGENLVLPYLVFVTGPSRTADIELSLTLGVHGPGKVIVVIGP